MAKILKKPSPPKTEMEAIEWQVRSAGSSFTPREQGQMDEWVNTSQEHADSIHRVEWFSNALDRLDTGQIEELRALKHQPRSFSPWQVGLGIAATIAGLCVATWWFLGGSYLRADFATGMGESRAVTLEDGSIVDLNTDSAIKIDLSHDTRQVTLLGGEAFFTVASDPSRPFEVVVGKTTIRALGTAFNVRTTSEGAAIAVQEHSIRITSAENGTTQDVSQGQLMRVDQDGKPGTATPYDERRLLAWRRHKLMFEHQPLNEMIAELNRYRPGMMISLDPRLKDVTVTGVFDTTRIDDALHTIESALPVKILRITDRLVILFHSASAG